MLRKENLTQRWWHGQDSVAWPFLWQQPGPSSRQQFQPSGWPGASARGSGDAKQVVSESKNDTRAGRFVSKPKKRERKMYPDNFKKKKFCIQTNFRHLMKKSTKVAEKFFYRTHTGGPFQQSADAKMVSIQRAKSSCVPKGIVAAAWVLQWAAKVM